MSDTEKRLLYLHRENARLRRRIMADSIKLRAALEQPKGEVVGEVVLVRDEPAEIRWCGSPLPDGSKLYAGSPEQRKPLTAGQIAVLHLEVDPDRFAVAPSVLERIVRAVERAHGIE